VLLAVIMLLIIWQGLKLPTQQPLSWRITRIVTALASSAPMIVAGLSLLAEEGGGLYWLVAAVILAFCAGVGNAWVLLVEVVRDERYRPVAERESP
jgi:hypothetical protein